MAAGAAHLPVAPGRADRGIMPASGGKLAREPDCASLHPAPQGADAMNEQMERFQGTWDVVHGLETAEKVLDRRRSREVAHTDRRAAWRDRSGDVRKRRTDHGPAAGALAADHTA